VFKKPVDENHKGKRGKKRGEPNGAETGGNGLAEKHLRSQPTLGQARERTVR